jgi:hypothetical protein
LKYKRAGFERLSVELDDNISGGAGGCISGSEVEALDETAKAIPKAAVTSEL